MIWRSRKKRKRKKRRRNISSILSGQKSYELKVNRICFRKREMDYTCEESPSAGERSHRSVQLHRLCADALDTYQMRNVRKMIIRLLAKLLRKMVLGFSFVSRSLNAMLWFKFSYRDACPHACTVHINGERVCKRQKSAYKSHACRGWYRDNAHRHTFVEHAECNYEQRKQQQRNIINCFYQRSSIC